MADKVGVDQEPIDLLIALSPESLEYWRNAMFWKALKNFVSMVSPAQVLAEIEIDSDPKLLTAWLHGDPTYPLSGPCAGYYCL